MLFGLLVLVAICIYLLFVVDRFSADFGYLGFGVLIWCCLFVGFAVGICVYYCLWLNWYIGCFCCLDLLMWVLILTLWLFILLVAWGFDVCFLGFFDYRFVVIFLSWCLIAS